MAGWLEQYLAQLGGGQNALLAAAATGGTLAPPAAGQPVAQPTAPVSPDDAVRALVAGYQAFLRRRPDGDPLQQRVESGRGRVRLVPESAGPSGLAAAAGLTTHGPRAGLARLRYSLGDGRVAHVYYDRRGRRQVMVFRPSP